MIRKWSLTVMAITMLCVSVFGACPNKCSGHGRCKANDVCDCMQNWTGGDCSARVCSYSRAWHDTAVANDDAHYYAECSNRGVCDRDKGICDCDPGFTGSGCRRLACPDDCSGHGTCEYIEDLAGNGFDKRIGGSFGRTYTLWDQEKIMGCRCDRGYEGHNCAKRVCPKGDDPLTTGQYEMYQAIDLNTDALTGSGFLTYHDPYGGSWQTEKIVLSATPCANIQAALRSLPNNVLNTVVVTSDTPAMKIVRVSRNSASGTVTSVAATGTICIVSFKSEPGSTGYQNLLECDVSSHGLSGQHPISAGGTGSPTCTVYEHVPGASAGAVTRPLSELAPCSNRGKCDSATGICQCYSGHMGLACERQEALV